MKRSYSQSFLLTPLETPKARKRSNSINVIMEGEYNNQTPENQAVAGSDPTPENTPIEFDDDELRRLTRTHWREIQTHVTQYRTMRSYNFRLTDLKTKTIVENLRKVYNDQLNLNGPGLMFKAVLRLGYFLMNKTSGQLQWYYPGYNTTLTPTPILIKSAHDLARAEQLLSGEDYAETLLNYAPSSSYIFIAPSNLQINVVPIRDMPLRGGLSPDDFPDSLKINKSLYCFLQNGHGKNLLEDGLCLFRCLAVYLCKKNPQKCEGETKKLARRYCSAHNLVLKKFPGVSVSELELVEDVFDIGLKVYASHDTAADHKFLLRPPSEGKQNGVCHLFIFKQKHFCLIKPGEEDTFISGFQCEKCGKLEKTYWEKKRHERDCRGGIKTIYKKGNYRKLDTMVERLEKVDIQLDKITDVFQPFFVVFDAETRMQKPVEEMVSMHTVYEFEHKPIVLCAASNLPQEWEKIFINLEDENATYLRQFFAQIEHWRLMAKDINFNRVQYIFDQLDDKIEETGNNPNQILYRKRLENIKKKLEEHLQTINVISFNGRGYDVPLMRDHFLPLLDQFGDTVGVASDLQATAPDDDDDDDEAEEDYSTFLDDDGDMDQDESDTTKRRKSGITFLLKQGASRYDAILAKHIRVLDVLNYLGGQSVSLRNFVSNFSPNGSAKIDKAWFPYEILKEIASIDDLKFRGMPRIENFISDLDGKNVLGNNEQDIATNYAEFQRLWREKDCSTLYDWLLEYVKIDCLCMIPAVETLQQQWYDQGVDLFSRHCTIQSAMTPLLLNSAPNEMYFVVPDEDTFKLLRGKGMVGGLAEIFTRHQEQNVTPVAPGSNTMAQVIQSLDSNSQYLAALGSEMPAGQYLIRDKDKNFRPVLGGEQRTTTAIQWLDYIMHTEGINIRHKLNGDEPLIYFNRKQMHPDGWQREARVVYEFDGCHTHGCHRDSCPVSKLSKEISPVTGKTYELMKLETKNRNLAWQVQGMKLVVKQECEFKDELTSNLNLKVFVMGWTLGPRRFGPNVRPMSEAEMAGNLKSGGIFGFALVDLEVSKDHPNYDKMLMFPPIIRHMTITPEMISPEMMSLAEQSDGFSKPRKNLVACMTGKKVLVYTPLLKYLTEIGVIILSIHKVIQFPGGQFPFKDFENTIADQRREGDRTGNTVKTNIAKHMGASAWGKFAYNPTTRNKHQIVQDQKFQKILNGPRYLSHLELGQEYLEVQLQQKTIAFDLPIQIAVAVYGAAKLNLLRFVHGFILKYFDHTKLGICGSDTDSVLVSWGSSNPETLVLPHMKEEYEKVKYDFVVDERTPEAEAYTKRKPGLFKVEKESTAFVGLSAKCYIMADAGKTLKHAAKGVSAKNNEDILCYDCFKGALEDGKAVQATNIGFRTKPKMTGIYTYRGTRVGLQPFYIKRYMLPPDLVYSQPLDESLEPECI